MTLTDGGTRTRPPGSAGRLFEPGGPRSLDDLIVRLSRSLVVRGNGGCPVCGATLVREPRNDGSVAACGDCGSSLD